MTKAKAIEIFNNLNSESFTDMEKIEAIVEVSNFPTHNSVTKGSMVDAIRILTELIAKLLGDGKETAE